MLTAHLGLWVLKMSGLWTDPPILFDGTLDYANLTLAEIREDLAETLADLVINAGQKELAPLFNAIEEDDLRESLANASGQPSERLVSIMNDLIKLEPYGHLPESGFELVKSAIQELRSSVIAV